MTAEKKCPSSFLRSADTVIRSSAPNSSSFTPCAGRVYSPHNPGGKSNQSNVSLLHKLALFLFNSGAKWKPRSSAEWATGEEEPHSQSHHPATNNLFVTTQWNLLYGFAKEESEGIFPNDKQEGRKKLVHEGRIICSIKGIWWNGKNN